MAIPTFPVRLSALAAAALLLAACFTDDSEDGPPPPRPEGLAAVYDTATGEVTVSWRAGVDTAKGSYELTRTDSVEGRFHGYRQVIVRDTFHRDTLFGSGPFSLPVKSHFSLRTLLRRSGTVALSEPSDVHLPCPSPLNLGLIPLGKTVAVARPGSLSPDTLTFGGFVVAGFPVSEVTLSIDRDSAPPAGLSLAQTPWSPGKDEFDFNRDGRLRVLVGAAAPGEYHLHVSARAGRFSLADSVPFRVSTSEPLDVRTVSLGARAHPTLGSFLDLDALQAHTAAHANAAAADIDLVFARARNGPPNLYSPKAAADQVTAPGGEAWVKSVLGDQARVTALRKLRDGATPLATLADLETAWSLGGETGDHAPLIAGLTFLARSDRGLVVALRTVAVDTSDSGTLTLEARSIGLEP